MTKGDRITHVYNLADCLKMQVRKRASTRYVCIIGVVAILWEKSLSNDIEVLKSDNSGRCSAVKVHLNSKSIILFNIH